MADETNSSPQLHYRSDITGLRAIAVLSVLLFHFKVGLFRGGFVGVDIFFVISGYLITRQILEQSAAGRFSFWIFYARRMSRILPALIFAVAITFLCGLLWLSPEFMRGLAKESTHALLSISNIQYWREANEYFAPKSDQLALLHFWSLSLEEQFYFVWPAFILLSLRLSRPFRFIAFVSICSLLAALLWSFKSPETVFFLMPFRIFEFGLGALVIFTERHFRLSDRVADAAFIAAFAAICIGVFGFDSALPFLGFAVALPSLGAAAIIHVQGASRLSPLLANKLFIFVGEISHFSLFMSLADSVLWTIYFRGRGGQRFRDAHTCDCDFHRGCRDVSFCRAAIQATPRWRGDEQPTYRRGLSRFHRGPFNRHAHSVPAARLALAIVAGDVSDCGASKLRHGSMRILRRSPVRIRQC